MLRILLVTNLLLAPAILNAGPGNYNLQGPALIGTGTVGHPQLGYAVAISADGNTALIGAPGDSNEAGAAFVFTRSNGVWSQQGEKIASGIGGSLGRSVALSADGNTALIGGDYTSSGAVLYTRSGGIWTEETVLSATDYSFSSGGYAVALSADGNTAFVSDITAGEYSSCVVAFAGTVFAFVRSGGTWTHQGGLGGSIYTGPPCPDDTGDYASGDGLGQVVVISGDGNTLASNASGGTKVTTRVADDWSYPPQLVPENGPVALSSDGSTMFFYNGAVYRLVNGVWTKTGPQIPLSSDFDSLVAVSTDGQTAIAQGTSIGSLRLGLYVLTGGVWNLHHEYPFNTTSPCGQTVNNSASAALSADGDTMIAGLSCEDSLAGSARAFASPQLNATLTHAGNFTQGQTAAQYTVAVSNGGDRDTNSPVNLLEKLPVGLTATAISGDGWTCTLVTVSCTRSDALAVGATYPEITVVVNVATNAPASQTNSVKASGGGSAEGYAKDITTIVH